MEIIPVLQSADCEISHTQEQIEQVKERNKYDIMLYEEAKKLFYDKYLVTEYSYKPTLQYVDEIQINFAKKINGEGFGNPIYFFDLLYRPIVSSGRAFIKVPLLAGDDYRMIIYANKTINDPHFKIYCNGHEVIYKSSKSKVYMSIPREYISQSGYTKIEFVVDNLNSQELKWDRTDNTSGYAFRRIDIGSFE